MTKYRIIISEKNWVEYLSFEEADTYRKEVLKNPDLPIEPVEYNQAEVFEVPNEVTLWQLRKLLKRTKLTEFHNEQTVLAIGAAIGLTPEQAIGYSLFQWVKYIISIMPEDTQEQRDAKDTAEEAIEYANYIERKSPEIAAIGQVMMLSEQNKDWIFMEAKKE